MCWQSRGMGVCVCVCAWCHPASGWSAAGWGARGPDGNETVRLLWKPHLIACSFKCLYCTGRICTCRLACVCVCFQKCHWVGMQAITRPLPQTLPTYMTPPRLQRGPLGALWSPHTHSFIYYIYGARVCARAWKSAFIVFNLICLNVSRAHTKQNLLTFNLLLLLGAF